MTNKDTQQSHNLHGHSFAADHVVCCRSSARSCDFGSWLGRPRQAGQTGGLRFGGRLRDVRNSQSDLSLACTAHSFQKRGVGCQNPTRLGHTISRLRTRDSHVGSAFLRGVVKYRWASFRGSPEARLPQAGAILVAWEHDIFHADLRGTQKTSVSRENRVSVYMASFGVPCRCAGE